MSDKRRQHEEIDLSLDEEAALQRAEARREEEATRQQRADLMADLLGSLADPEDIDKALPRDDKDKAGSKGKARSTLAEELTLGAKSPDEGGSAPSSAPREEASDSKVKY
jgi:hypothetical protein